MNFEVKDLTGLGAPLTKLLDVIQRSCGTLYEPTHVRRLAKAQADGLKLIEAAKTEAQIESGRLLNNADPVLLLAIPGISPELAQRAQSRLAHQELGRQENIDQVIGQAAASLPNSVSAEPVNADWANRFFSVASDVSDAEMQSLWGKILAGETAAPGKFSVRTLDVLRNLSRREAETFRRACSLAAGTVNRRILRVPDTDPDTMLATESKALEACGLSYPDIAVLTEAGLLLAGDNTALPVNVHSSFTISMNGKKLLCEAIAGSPYLEALASGLPIIAFTIAGNELSTLIQDDFQAQYVALLSDRYKGYGLAMKVLD